MQGQNSSSSVVGGERNSVGGVSRGRRVGSPGCASLSVNAWRASSSAENSRFRCAALLAVASSDDTGEGSHHRGGGAADRFVDRASRTSIWDTERTVRLLGAFLDPQLNGDQPSRLYR